MFRVLFRNFEILIVVFSVIGIVGDGERVLRRFLFRMLGFSEFFLELFTELFGFERTFIY